MLMPVDDAPVAAATVVLEPPGVYTVSALDVGEVRAMAGELVLVDVLITLVPPLFSK